MVHLKYLHVPALTRDPQDNDQLKDRQYTHSFIHEEEVIGRDGDKEAIIDLLMNNEDISVIAIVGRGGIGKTTLAQSIYNDQKIVKHFELELWVCISEEVDIKIIVKKIIEPATNKKPESHEMDILQNNLRREIDGKKYLLIMDDVWNEDYEKWDNLKNLLEGGAKGSRILITTRSKQVADTFDTTLLYSLEKLDEDNSWLLFKRMTFKGGEDPENPNLIEIGKEIVAKLKGVPLAIRIIGRLLYSKTSEVDWLSFRDDEINTVMQQENDITSILKLSYNHLPFDLKQCFAYCSIFPKDYVMKKGEVVTQWIAQGFVQPQNKNKTIEDVGEDYFMELLWRSFFQDMRKDKWGDIMQCKMHDLIHDLASMVLENGCVAGKPIDIRTRHMSLDNFHINSEHKPPESLLVAENLRTLLFGFYYSYWKGPFYDMFCKFLKLRTLVMQRFEHEKLPTCIGRLKHLRYLDLSRGQFEFLPDSITELYNLETLILARCRCLKELPRETKNWINLRHLDLQYCYNLICTPKGLGGMTNLLTMNLFAIGKSGGSLLEELNGLNNLRGSLTVRGLEFLGTADLQRNASYLKLKPGLQRLKLYWACDEDKLKIDVLDDDDDDERVLECLQPHPNLRELHIVGYHGVRLCNWLSPDSLVNLVTIRLSRCQRLHRLPQFDRCPSLKNLELENLTCIEYIDDDDSLSSSEFFPSLERLWISDMPNLKRWWKGETAELVQKSISLPTLSCLSKLTITNCCQLTSFPWHPPLQSLVIEGVGTRILDMVMNTTTNVDANSTSALSKLKYLVLGRIEDLEFLPEEIFYNPSILEDLTIRDCSNFQMSYSRAVQQDLTIGHCNKGEICVDEDDKDMLWQKLASLRHLSLEGISKLECFPKGLQHVTTLRSLWLHNSPNLKTLPESIGNLTSLSELKITKCPNLTSLPQGIAQLRSLIFLYIGGCPKLKERCGKEIGEDWPKVAHVPNFGIYCW